MDAGQMLRHQVRHHGVAGHRAGHGHASPEVLGGPGGHIVGVPDGRAPLRLGHQRLELRGAAAQVRDLGGHRRASSSLRLAQAENVSPPSWSSANRRTTRST